MLLRRSALDARAASTFSLSGGKGSVSGEVITATYAGLGANAERVASALRAAVATLPDGANAVTGGIKGDVGGVSVALMADPGAEYVAGTLGVWAAGGVVVPLALSHPDHELKYVLGDARVQVVLATATYAHRLGPLAEAAGAKLIVIEWDAPPPNAASTGASDCAAAPEDGDAWSRTVAEACERLGDDRGALVIYTSGTTGRPKGALHTHGSISAQVSSLCEAWEWDASDRILHCLPMHHIHGIVNACYCALSAGATVEFLPKFSPTSIWNRLIDGYEGRAPPLTLFMGVPTMYVRLLQAYDAYDEATQARCRAAASALRLAVSGSAACPVPLFERWEAVTGARLLERYGMSEIGMALSNPFAGGERRAGAVGVPLPGVEAVLVDFATGESCPPGTAGEIRIKGRNLFKEYLGRPKATADAYDEHGYFKTGDAAVIEDGYWRILGRESVDIIKSGGYKVRQPTSSGS